MPHHRGQAPAALLAVLERPWPCFVGALAERNCLKFHPGSTWPFEIFSFYIKTMRICCWLHVSRCPQRAEGITSSGQGGNGKVPSCFIVLKNLDFFRF